ncbi:hypothetical protein APSETT445_007567 [Aspergillus pseudonomiae]
MPFIWQKSAADSIISHDRDAFDVTFRAYDGEQPPSEPPHPSPVPATLHHVHLGDTALRPEWLAAREECLRIHPGWKTHTWDDTTANQFVREHFPELQDTWNSYPYLVQKVDALRYMILTIYTTQPNRTSLRVLSGPSDNPNLHMLNGFVDTPLFRHLGTSSWHANDALFVRMVEEFGGRVLYCVLSAVVVGGCVMVSLSLAARRRSVRMETPTSPSKVSEKVV